MVHAQRTAHSVVSAVAALLLAALAALAPPAVAATEGPALATPRSVLDAALHCPTSFTDPAHQPVLLVHGTATNAEESWSSGFAKALGQQGYDVCTVDLPGYSLVDIQTSSEYVVNAVRRIHAATGEQVDAAGHSQGNLELRWATRWWPDVQAAVDDLVLLGNPSHGIVAGYPTCALPCFPAAWQLRPHARFLDALNSGDETPGTISYSSVYSETDEFIVPSSTALLSGGTNVAVQSLCPGRVVTHLALLFDAAAFALTVDAFSHQGAASAARVGSSACRQLYAPGVTATEVTARTAQVAAGFTSRIALGPRVISEPPVRGYAAG